MQSEKVLNMQVEEHCLLGKQAQSINILINATVVVRNHFWLFTQCNRKELHACSLSVRLIRMAKSLRCVDYKQGRGLG